MGTEKNHLEIDSSDQQVSFRYLSVFNKLWLGGPYESGEAFISAVLDSYSALSTDERLSFKQAVIYYSDHKKISNDEPIKGLIKLLN